MFKEISSQPVWTGGTIRNTNNSPYEHLSVALKQICNNLNRSFRANFFTIISVSIAPFPLQTDDTCCRKKQTAAQKTFAAENQPSTFTLSDLSTQQPTEHDSKYYTVDQINTFPYHVISDGLCLLFVLFFRVNDSFKPTVISFFVQRGTRSRFTFFGGAIGV